MGTPACPNYADLVIPSEVTEAAAFSALLPQARRCLVRITPWSAYCRYVLRPNFERRLSRSNRCSVGARRGPSRPPPKTERGLGWRSQALEGLGREDEPPSTCFSLPRSSAWLTHAA